MNRHRINRISGVAPIVLSLLAFGLVIVGIITGPAKPETDENAFAHIFQLLIASEVPFILAFFATADWSRAATVGRLAALQCGALLLALAPVAILRL